MPTKVNVGVYAFHLIYGKTVASKFAPTPNPFPPGGGGLRGSLLGAQLGRLCEALLQQKSPSPLRGGVRGGGISRQLLSGGHRQ